MNEFNGITEKKPLKIQKLICTFSLQIDLCPFEQKIKTHYIMQKYTKLRPAIENPTVTHLA